MLTQAPTPARKGVSNAHYRPGSLKPFSFEKHKGRAACWGVIPPIFGLRCCDPQKNALKTPRPSIQWPGVAAYDTERDMYDHGTKTTESTTATTPAAVCGLDRCGNEATAIFDHPDRGPNFPACRRHARYIRELEAPSRPVARWRRISRDELPAEVRR